MLVPAPQNVQAAKYQNPCGTRISQSQPSTDRKDAAVGESYRMKFLVPSLFYDGVSFYSSNNNIFIDLGGRASEMLNYVARKCKASDWLRSTQTPLW
jgi:hypothetical protein